MNKKIVLFSSTFFWKDSNQVLFYSSDNSEWLLFNLDEDISNLCEQWSNMDNLYSAKPHKWTPAVLTLSSLLSSKKMGITLNADERFVSLLPALWIRNSVERVSESGYLESEEILPYFHYLTAFLGGSCDDNDYWKQMSYPINTSKRLDASNLVGIVSKYNNDYLRMVDIIVSDISGGVRMGNEIKTLSDLAELLLPFRNKVSFSILLTEAYSSYETVNVLLNKGFLVTFICLDKDLPASLEIDSRIRYCLIVRSEEEIKRWDSIFKDLKDVKYYYSPLADNNLAFFRKNVFLSQEDILSQKLTKKQIFAHQALNKFCFGRLYLMPDGTIRSIPDGPSLGESCNPIYGPIIKELEENYAWRQTRMLMEPCKNCLYRDLCPSPSVYEKILGCPGCTYWKE